MLKRLIPVKLTMLAVALLSLSAMQAQTIPARGFFIPISTYRDDPFVAESVIERMHRGRFRQAGEEGPALHSNQVEILDEAFIYREDRSTGEFTPFAWNPWPETRPNENGDFSFPNEERFPLFRPERGPDGKIVLREGLQVWTLNNLNLGLTTAFEAAHAVKNAADAWAGRDIRWGEQTGEREGELHINSHSFIDFNAFYAPGARRLFFGVVPYRLPGETEVRMFETATSWEMVGHECGHAIHHTLKPNADVADHGFQTWSESFGDQTEMWTSLLNRERVCNLLTETNGNLHQSNSLTRLAEAFAAVTGEGTGIRDAFHDKKVSDTTEEIHDRSEALTGAAYKIFLAIYDALKCDHGVEEALRQAGQIMGIFLARAADYTPENRMTLEDVAKAYLKVDKEFFDSRYHGLLVWEFLRREIFDAGSEQEWMTHEAARPELRFPRRPSDGEVDALLQANLDSLGIGPNFGLKLQSITRTDLIKRAPGSAQTIVRVQLTQGRGDGATLLDNHGILVFRANGTLADFHAPLPPDGYASLLPDAFAQTQALAKLSQASRLSLDEHGAPLAFVRKADGPWTVEARVLRGEGPNVWMEVFTLDNPRGERREVVIPPLPPDKRIRIANDLLK